MIWYDVVTKDPVAPGSCEDSGIPSIEGYDCVNCKRHVDPDWDSYDVHAGGKVAPLIRVGYGLCPECGFIMLTTIV